MWLDVSVIRFFRDYLIIFLVIELELDYYNSLAVMNEI